MGDRPSFAVNLSRFPGDVLRCGRKQGDCHAVGTAWGGADFRSHRSCASGNLCVVVGVVGVPSRYLCSDLGVDIPDRMDGHSMYVIESVAFSVAVGDVGSAADTAGADSVAVVSSFGDQSLLSFWHLQSWS